MSAPGRRAPAGSFPGAGETAVATFPADADTAPFALVGLGAGAEASPGEPAEPSQPASAAGDSLTVAAWTVVSRVTGLARVAVIGAVLGPTYTGNTYQFTNSLPNLLYYGFLAGGFFSSLLVPALVRHIDAGDWRASNRVAGGFLGVTLAAMAAITPLAIILGPLALKVAALGGPHAAGAAEVRVGRLLIIMFIPQIFLYGVVGTATAVMNARRRFALAAGAPAVENLGTIAVLGATAALYGTGRSISNVPAGELLLLGLGSTGAVALHAATQWWGARRAGVVLLPRPGWRDSEVRAVMRRAVPALAQAGLDAVQLLALLIAADRLPGGIVAFQIAWNLYNLANNVGTAPVALSLVPRLARMHLDGDETAFRDTLVRGLALGFFITIPAAVAFLFLEMPLASAVSFGRMDSAAGVAMVAAALGPLSAAVVGQTAFMITTYASYARKDTRSPLRSMMWQAAICLAIVSLSLLVHGPAVLFILGLAVSGSVVVAACHLMARMWRALGRGTQRLAPSLARFTAGAVVMAGPAWLTATVVPGWLGRPLGPRAGIIAAALVGAAVYVAVEALWRTPEVGWLAGGLRQMRGRARVFQPGRAMVSGSLPAGAPARPGRVAGRYWDGRLLRRPPGRWLIGPALVGAATAGAMTALGPLKALLALAVVTLMACVWRRPVLAAYLAIGLTPLTVSLNLGGALPLIRPNEAIDLIMGATLAARGLTMARTGRLPRIRLDRIELAIVLMAVSNSVVPLLWMTVRQEAITQGDILYALVMWKLLGIYVIVRAAVRTDRQVRRCLWLSVTVASIVALIAVLQSLSLFGVPRLLAEFFGGPAEFGPAGGRGSSTLGLPAATADLLVFNLAIVAGLWTRYRRHGLALMAAAALMLFGALAAGEFAGAIGLVVGIICIAIVSGSPRLLAWFVPAAAVGGYVLWPVLSTRLSGFQSAAGLPDSWLGRLQNLETYFWPKLFSDWNFLLGVQPSAVLNIVSYSGNEVWIESGYTWLLWGGGIPLLASFLFFTWVTVRTAWQAAWGRDARSVAGTATFVAVIVIAVLMIFDPHLTYRGSADDFFFLIALVAPRDRHDQPSADDHAAQLDARGFHMTPDNTIRGANGHAGRPRRLRPARPPWQPSPSRSPGDDSGRRLARLTARQLRRAPNVPGSWSRFLVAHACWILTAAVVAVVAAGALVHAQTPSYQSLAVVAVQPPAVAASSGNPPNMATEEGIVTSVAVLAKASRVLNVPEATLASGVSVHVPGTTSLLQITYSDPVPRIAQQRAQAVAQAYVSYRSPGPAAAPGKTPAKSAALGMTPSAVLITPASMPTSPASPDDLIDIGAALIVGLALGIGTAGLRDYLDDRLRGPLDLEAQAAAPVLALIPAFRPARRDPGGRLVIVASPDSLVAEAYRGLRTRLVQVAAARDAKTVLVTSPGWEDKGTIAANLAAALAQSGREVVLVCADLRWGRAHELFGLGEGCGLSGLLEGQTNVMRALRATKVPGLRVLPPGVVPADPAALLEGPAWPAALSVCQRHADVVVIEAPPVLASPDTSVLADLAEMILIVADARWSTRVQVRAAMRELEPARGKLVGGVLDNVGRRGHLRSRRPERAAGHPAQNGADGRRAAGSDGRAAGSDDGRRAAGSDEGRRAAGSDDGRRAAGSDSDVAADSAAAPGEGERETRADGDTPGQPAVRPR